jgi:hypothetical protein
VILPRRARLYNYMNFGAKTETIPTSISPPGLFAPFTENISQTIQTATVRLNYRFGGFGGLLIAEPFNFSLQRSRPRVPHPRAFFFVPCCTLDSQRLHGHLLLSQQVCESNWPLSSSTAFFLYRSAIMMGHPA